MTFLIGPILSLVIDFEYFKIHIRYSQCMVAESMAHHQFALEILSEF